VSLSFFPPFFFLPVFASSLSRKESHCTHTITQYTLSTFLLRMRRILNLVHMYRNITANRDKIDHSDA
jgi:hypothetical protein